MSRFTYPNQIISAPEGEPEIIYTLTPDRLTYEREDDTTVTYSSAHNFQAFFETLRNGGHKFALIWDAVPEENIH